MCTTIRRDLHEVAFTAALVSTGSYHSDASYRICCLYVQCLTHTETAEENSAQNKLSNDGFCKKFGLRSPVRRMEYLALEKIYASDSRVFTTKIIRFVWNIPSISRDSKNERFATLVLLLIILNRLLLLMVSISRSVTLKKYFMIANIYNFLHAFHTFSL